MSDDARFLEVVSIACHDLRTPLATVHGFARTLARTDLGERESRYVDMIEAASAQLAELLDELALVTRIESGRYRPTLETTDSLQLARDAAGELAEGSATVSGEGAAVSIDVESTRRAVRQLARAAKRHGGVDVVHVEVRGAALEMAPVGRSAAAVVTGEDVRELAAPAAVAHLRALGGSVELVDERLVLRLPTPE